MRFNNTNWRRDGDSNPGTNTNNPNNSYKLQDTQEAKATKNCPNRVVNPQNQSSIPKQSNQIAESILAINNLPLTPDEKAQMIRLLLR